jgi:glucose/arabinose dehydrogenase
MQRRKLLGCALGLGAVAFAKNKRFNLPAPNPAGATANAAKVIPQPPGAKLKLPNGFVAEEFASGFQKPRIMVELPGGTVLVTESILKGSVVALGPGKSKKTLIANLDRPFGMALWKDYLYVAEAEAVKRYKLDAKAVTVGAGEEIVPLKGYGKGHWSRGIAFDPKGEKFYLSVGSSSNIDAGDPADRAAIHVYNADGSGKQVFATGLRNAVNVRINPQSGKPWVTVQERDGLGDDLVPDFFTSVKKGAFYGWPYAYIGSNEEPRHKGANPDAVKKAIEPDILLNAHASAMDFAFYTAKQFPAKFHNGAFIASRGSSNRAKRVGYSVLFVPFANGKPSGPPEDFLTGFMLGEDKKEVWGRPVGLLQLADGSLLLSEDGNNKIWRISFKG